MRSTGNPIVCGSLFLVEPHLQQHFAVLVAFQYAAKAAAAVDKLLQLHLRLEPGPILEIGRTDQDAVNSGRRDFEKIAALDRDRERRAAATGAG